MTTKATNTRRNVSPSGAIAEVKEKLTQKAIVLQIQYLSIEKVIPDPIQPRKT